MALLLPAVQAARESARRAIATTTCGSTVPGGPPVRDDPKTLPPYFGPFPSGARSVEGGWFVHLLPYIEQGTITDEIIANGGGLGQTRIWSRRPAPITRLDIGSIRRRATGKRFRARAAAAGPTTTAIRSVYDSTQPRLGRPATVWVSRHTARPPVSPFEPRPGRGERGDVQHRALPQRSSTRDTHRVTFRFNTQWGLTNYLGNFHAFSVNGNRAQGPPHGRNHRRPVEHRAARRGDAAVRRHVSAGPVGALHVPPLAQLWRRLERRAQHVHVPVGPLSQEVQQLARCKGCTSAS